MTLEQRSLIIAAKQGLIKNLAEFIALWNRTTERKP